MVDSDHRVQHPKWNRRGRYWATIFVNPIISHGCAVAFLKGDVEPAGIPSPIDACFLGPSTDVSPPKVLQPLILDCLEGGLLPLTFATSCSCDIGLVSGCNTISDLSDELYL
jgi:hypothetical protein